MFVFSHILFVFINISKKHVNILYIIYTTCFFLPQVTNYFFSVPTYCPLYFTLQFILYTPIFIGFVSKIPVHEEHFSSYNHGLWSSSIMLNLHELNQTINLRQKHAIDLCPMNSYNPQHKIIHSTYWHPSAQSTPVAKGSMVLTLREHTTPLTKAGRLSSLSYFQSPATEWASQPRLPRSL